MKKLATIQIVNVHNVLLYELKVTKAEYMYMFGFKEERWGERDLYEAYWKDDCKTPLILKNSASVIFIELLKEFRNKKINKKIDELLK